MTYREDPPEAASCPLCGRNDDVERHGRRWLCGHDWTLFTGSQDEWEAMRARRERHAKHLANLAAKRQPIDLQGVEL